MPSRLFAVGVVGVVVLAGCGGSDSATKTIATVSASRVADLQVASLGAAADVSDYCYEAIGGTQPDRARVTDAVARLVDAYRASQWAPALRKDVRKAASTLRNCDEEGQADRLDRLADEH